MNFCGIFYGTLIFRNMKIFINHAIKMQKPSHRFRHHIFVTFSKTIQKKQNGIANQLVMPFSLLG